MKKILKNIPPETLDSCTNLRLTLEQFIRKDFINEFLYIHGNQVYFNNHMIEAHVFILMLF